MTVLFLVHLKIIFDGNFFLEFFTVLQINSLYTFSFQNMFDVFSFSWFKIIVMSLCVTSTGFCFASTGWVKKKSGYL